MEVHHNDQHENERLIQRLCVNSMRYNLALAGDDYSIVGIFY